MTVLTTADHLRIALARIEQYGWTPTLAYGVNKPRSLLMSLPYYGPEVLAAIRACFVHGDERMSIGEWEMQAGRNQLDVQAVLTQAINNLETSNPKYPGTVGTPR